MRTQRVASFLFAFFMILSTLGAVFLVVQQNRDADKQDEITQNALNEINESTQNNQQENNQMDNSSNTKAGEPLKLSAPVEELQITDTILGTGETAQLNDNITVNYRLNLIDGTIVAGNDTFASGSPVSFGLVKGGLIEGWIQGIPGMKVGGLRRLVVPASLGYGEGGTNGIPGNSTLIFDVELVDIQR